MRASPLLPARLRLPPATVGVGPAGWLERAGPGGAALPRHDDLDACRWELPAGGEEPLVLLHGPHLMASGQFAGLAAWLSGLAGAVAVLVGGDLDAGTCAALVRAGLFDYVPAGAPAATWREVRERVERRRRRTAAARAVQAEAESTQRLLREQWRQVQADAAREAAALAQTQHELEVVNRQLAAHMDQLSLLYRFGRELSVAKNWDQALRHFLEHLARFVGAQGAALVLRAAPHGGYAPRQLYRWDEASWESVLLAVSRDVDGAVAGNLLAPGVFRIRGGRAPAAGGIAALPLERQGARVGFLLLRYASAAEREERTANVLPFLQMVQVVLSEEVAGAQMLDRIREFGAFNARVLQAVRSAIWVCDASGRTLFANDAARALLGAPAAPIATTPDPATDVPVGRGRLEDWFDPAGDREDLPEIFLDKRLRLEDGQGPRLAALFARGEPLQAEGSLEDRAGMTVPVLVHAAPMPGRWHDERWLLVVAEDLREARRAEAARRRADRLESLVEMSATLAHEIRNPLAGLSAQAELLAEHLPPADSRKRYLDVITGEVGRIDQTITRMLQFVRAYEPQLRACDLAAVANDSATLAAARARAEGVELRLATAPSDASWSCRLDPAQIKQVMLNLLLNAIDAAPRGGHVALRLIDRPRLELRDGISGRARVAPGLEVVVEDDGPGFAVADVETIFRPFYTTKSAGTGLGLAISRKVVAAHGGEILAEREGAVTRMRVLLPRHGMAGATSAGEGT